MTALIRKYFPKWVKSSTRSRHTREKRVEAKSVFLLKSKQLTIVIVSITTIALVLISFLGQAPSGPGVSIDQLARIQVSAELPFAYESRIQTNRKIDLARKQVPPIYTVNYEHFSEYEVFINQLNDLILDFSRNNRNLPKNQQETKLAEALNEFVTNSEFTIDVRSFLTLYRETDFWGRYRLLQQGLTELWYIYKEGIFAQKTQLGMSRDYFSVVKITDSRGNTREVNAKSTNEALLDLRVRLSKLEKTEVIYQSLFEIMKEGIVVNLFYNETEHTKAIEAVTSKIAPVKIEIEKGDVIIELGTIVTARDMEKLNAYDLERRKLAKSAPLLGFYMLERIFFTLVVLGISITLIIVTFPENDRSNKHYLMCALMVTVNMIAIRLMLELGESNLFSD